MAVLEFPTGPHSAAPPHLALAASGFAAAAGAPVTVAAPTTLKETSLKTSPWAGLSEPDGGLPCQAAPPAQH